MTTSKTRDFFSTCVKNIESSLKQWDDAFNAENIPGTKLANTFHIIYTIPQINAEDQRMRDELDVTLSLYFKMESSIMSPTI